MKKSNKGFITYAVMLVIILVIAISLNGSLSNQVNRRIEYPELLTMIENHEVSAVAIRSNTLVGLKTNTRIAKADFPENNYDFETTIGSDFIETARMMRARELGKTVDEVSVGLYRGVPRAGAGAVVHGVPALHHHDGRDCGDLVLHDARADRRQRQGDELWQEPCPRAGARQEQDHLR